MWQLQIVQYSFEFSCQLEACSFILWLTNFLIPAAENQYSSYEDALLDVKHGGEDVDIPWEAYDEEDKRAAAGCRSAMTNTYKRH